MLTCSDAVLRNNQSQLLDDLVALHMQVSHSCYWWWSGVRVAISLLTRNVNASRMSRRVRRLEIRKAEKQAQESARKIPVRLTPRR